MADFNFDGSDDAQDLIDFQVEGHQVIIAAEAVALAQKIFLNKSIYALRNVFSAGAAGVTAPPYPEAPGYGPETPIEAVTKTKE